MTDTITPASLRAHADWIGNGSLPAAEHLRREADRLEAESARDEEAEKLAEVIAQAEQRSAVDELVSWRQLQVRSAARAVLDRLAADGRLLPECGVVTWPEFFAKNQPAPPAVSVPDNGPCTGAGDCDASPHEHGCFADTGDCDDPSDHPDSGPDGTPEKPWPTWQDVPEGVRYWSAEARKRNLPRINRGGKRYVSGGSEGSEYPGCGREAMMRYLAPFVRVDGDKA
ncbi:hypothetical protein [Prescottella equi]|uniref:hypothetical protein n=1 Tax=Rhodococcus hoagii TaxID=43767 RepID=UPI001EEB638F|nr:hypothetical protein [Prescottella equi]